MIASPIRTTTHPACFLGADVSKAWVDFADTSGRSVRVANTREALTAALSDPLWRERCANLVCEATGGYEWPLITAATALRLPIRRVHPSRARAFARATARLAKTDRIDAACLAALSAFTAEEARTPLPSPAQRALAELMTRLAQLKDQRHAEQCRADQVESPLVKRSIAASLALLDSLIATLTAPSAPPSPTTRSWRARSPCCAPAKASDPWLATPCTLGCPHSARSTGAR